MEKIGVNRAMKAAKGADLSLCGRRLRPLDESDREIMELIHDKKAIVLLNKTDLELTVDKEA